VAQRFSGIGWLGRAKVFLLGRRIPGGDKRGFNPTMKAGSSDVHSVNRKLNRGIAMETVALVVGSLAHAVCSTPKIMATITLSEQNSTGG
jgi:hypothetical protein